MRALAAEWIRKAEADAGTARREAAVKENPNWDAVCFHAQQAVEKYIKALLQQSEITFTETLLFGLPPILLRWFYSIHKPSSLAGWEFKRFCHYREGMFNGCSSECCRWLMN